MNLIPTDKAVAPIEAYHAQGWTDAQLVEHGIFSVGVELVDGGHYVVPPEHVTIEPQQSVWRDMRPAKTAEARPVVRNPFGVTDLAQVQAVYDEARHAARSAPGGWSFEAQLLEFAIQLCKGK